MPPANWYPSPDGRPLLRWWDGQRWTDDLYPLAAPLGSGGSGGQTASAGSGSRQSLDRWVKIAVPIYIAYATVTSLIYGLAAAPYYRALWKWFHTLTRYVHAGRPAPAPPQQPAWMLLLSLGSLALTGLGVLFLMWQHRAATQARNLGYPATHSPGWGVGAWFVPVVNLWMPYQALRDCLPPQHPARANGLRAWVSYLSLGLLNSAALLCFIFFDRGLGFLFFAAVVAAGTFCVWNARIAMAGVINAQEVDPVRP